MICFILFLFIFFLPGELGAGNTVPGRKCRCRKWAGRTSPAECPAEYFSPQVRKKNKKKKKRKKEKKWEKWEGRTSPAECHAEYFSPQVRQEKRKKKKKKQRKRGKC